MSQHSTGIELLLHLEDCYLTAAVTLMLEEYIAVDMAHKVVLSNWQKVRIACNTTNCKSGASLPRL